MSLHLVRRPFVVCLAVALAALSPPPAGAQAQAAAASVPAARPTLVVLLTVDQLRPNELDRWAPQLTGGLARLSKRGAYFVNAFHDHAATETAPGHSVTLSGRFPRSTGILRNSAGVDDPQSPLIASRETGASPYRFRGSTLIDWLRTRDARSRALSISRKDRGAILPLGRAKQNVFWYSASTGEFTTSRYYADTLPQWIRRVNARRIPQRMAGQSWTLLLPERDYAEPDSVPIEGAGRDFTFPHLISKDTTRAAGEITNTPWIDQVTLHAALEGVHALNIGRGPQTDLLAISLSATDAIGHRYGPDSREQHDNILRLDRTLGQFVDSLYRLRDSSTIVFALTADHGVTPFPALTAQRTGRPAPAQHDLAPPLRELRAALRQAGVDTGAVFISSMVVYVDRAAFARARVAADPILAAFATSVRRRPGIARVDAVRDLARRDTLRDPIARRWLHTIPADTPAEYVITELHGSTSVGATSAEHGSPYDDDARVPVIFYGPGIRAGRYAERALVADIAPTLARIIGVPPTERLDGRVLVRALLTGGR